MPKNWINIGKVGKSHGLKGDFFLSASVDSGVLNLERVKVGGSETNSEIYDVTLCRKQSGRQVIHLRGVDSREASEALLHQNVFAEREAFQASDDEFFWSDLFDKKVTLDNGTEIGKVKGVNNFGASDVVEIEGEGGKSLLLPFVEQYFDIEASIEGPVVRLNVGEEVVESLWAGGKRKPAAKGSESKS